MSGSSIASRKRLPRPLLGVLILCASCASGFEVEAPPTTDVPLQGTLEPEDGTIVSVVEALVVRPHDALSPNAQARFDAEEWEAARRSLVGRADLVTYSSGGLRIGGFLVRPEGLEGRRAGAVIVNRDGVGDSGLDEDELLVELSRYADRGYVAAASAYRGNRMSHGVDGFGGDDVRDVLGLVQLLTRLDDVDPRRIFMVGFGRGGLMTLRALEEGAAVRAAAVVSGIADLGELAERDATIEAGRGPWPGLARIHGPWEDEQRARELDRRSPGARAGEAGVPLLLIHGRLDDVVPVAQAREVAARLERAGTPYEAVIYGYGDHALVEQRADWQARVLDWIDRHASRALFN